MALDDLTELAAWMRTQGVRRARHGELELEFSRDPTPPGEARERKPQTEEDRRAEAIARRRREYERELGYKLSDEQLRQLP